jgi:hypothetical protein
LISDPWPFILIWILGGVLALIIPASKWTKNKNDFYEVSGKYIAYEQEQRAYEEANRQNNGDNNDENYYAIPTCRWYQWSCRKNAYYYQMQNNDHAEDQVQVPAWYLFLGGTTEEQQRQREEMGMSSQNNAPVKLVYVWSVVLFIILILYGVVVLAKGWSMNSLRVILLFWTQFCIMILILTAQGVIETDGRALEENIYGFYGQMGILLAYSSFWMALHSGIYTLVLTVRAVYMRWRENKQTTNTHSSSLLKEGEDVDDSVDKMYQKYEDEERPSVKIS